MNKKYIVTLIAVIGFISITGLCIIFFTGREPVETSERALEIAKEYVLKKYKHDFNEYKIEAFDGYEIDAELKDDIWIVCYFYIDESGYAVDGGGGPELWIKKSNGKIVYCELAE